MRVADAAETAEIRAIENLQREDLSEQDEAAEVAGLVALKGMEAIPELAERTGLSPEAIAGWLEDNGYAVPATFADAIAPYAGSATFVAVKLTPGSEDVVDLDPLVVTVPRPFETTTLSRCVRASTIA